MRVYGFRIRVLIGYVEKLGFMETRSGTRVPSENVGSSSSAISRQERSHVGEI